MTKIINQGIFRDAAKVWKRAAYVRKLKARLNSFNKKVWAAVGS